jgi:hypothetical protein
MATFERTTAVADKVLAAVKQELAGQTFTVVVYPYFNGREHGWTLVVAGSGHATGVTFSEYRNSDEIVVYPGTNPFVGAQPVTNEVYADKRFYPAGAYRRAAKFIARCLRARVPSRSPLRLA